MAKAETMKLIRKYTSIIPVPEVYNAYSDENGDAVILMDDGRDKYSDSEKESVISQLPGYIDELRSIKGSYIGSIDSSWCNDHFFDSDPGGYAPFATKYDFNQGIIKALREARPEGDWVEFTCDIFREVMV
ncbi:hypothetical protein PspLS_10811 [Pyricularia sp. CBS 133598]|nr:hypothetical protein PspLS_10811 [Pyricularia sp. CBS 133598]